jgi:hypothetical protein
MAFRTLTTVDLSYFITCENPHEWAFAEIHVVEGPVDFTLHLRVRDHAICVFASPLDTFFWALTISWSRLLARVWSGPWVV